jgi:hypothetical protein
MEQETPGGDGEACGEEETSRRSSVWWLWRLVEDETYVCRVCEAVGRTSTVKQRKGANSNLHKHFQKTRGKSQELAFPECSKALGQLEQESSKLPNGVDRKQELETRAAHIIHEVAEAHGSKRRRSTMERYMSNPTDREFQMTMEIWMARHAVSERAVDDFVFDKMLQMARSCSSSPAQSRKTRTDVIVSSMADYLLEELREWMETPDGTAAIFSITSDSWTSQHTKRK